MAKRYLDPKADLTFKRVFGEHPDLVISLLNALLPFQTKEEEIQSVEYLTPFHAPENPPVLGFSAWTEGLVQTR